MHEKTWLILKIGKACLIPILQLGLPALCLAAEPAPAQGTNTGYRCLFLGHSFFYPIARSFEPLPGKNGFPAHRQIVVAHASASGAPGALWKSDAADVQQAKALIATGTVDLVGLTYYGGHGSELEDYRKWVEFALAHNAKTRFVFQVPWAKYEDRSRAAFEARCELNMATVHSIIEKLRQAYPQTSFRCIPQSRWMAGLWKLYDEGKLPEIKVIQGTGKHDNASCLFTDRLGHGGDLPVRVSVLLWLAAIYDVDPTKASFETGVAYDLKAFSKDVLQRDPCRVERK